MKERGPSRKAKYYLVTDSGAVPWGKVEKNPGRGVKKNLKPYVYDQMESQELDIVLFVERSGELLYMARLNTKKVWSRSESESEKGDLSHI